MKPIETSQSIIIPKGIEVDVGSRKITVKGPRGKLIREFTHSQVEIIKMGKRRVKVSKYFGVRKEVATVRTICSHIQNMITGVTKGYKFKMHSVYAHFPINMSVQENNSHLLIRNFLGEKIERHVDMLEGVQVTPSTVKDEIIIEGNDLESVSHSCSLIKQSVAVKDKDIRKFLDGIYVSHKGHVVEEV